MRNDLEDRRRQEHNRNIVHRMNAGEDLVEFDEMESWYPRRPKVKKDKKQMARLYNLDEDETEVEIKTKRPLNLIR